MSAAVVDGTNGEFFNTVSRTVRMVEITDSLACLFTAELEADDEGSYTLSVPEREVEHGTVAPGGTYRIAVIDRQRDASATSESDGSPSGSVGERRSTDGASPNSDGSHDGGPPVSEGEVRDVTIETLGDKGDGIAKIERGYVVIVPDAELGDEVTVEITSVRENVSFASVIDE